MLSTNAEPAKNGPKIPNVSIAVTVTLEYDTLFPKKKKNCKL